jgi:hypothetical protein
MEVGAGFDWRWLSTHVADSLGYVGATVCIIVIALVCIHCMHMLVHSKKVLCQREGVGYLSYAVQVIRALESTIILIQRL